MDRPTKRNRASSPTTEDFLLIAREMWRREGRRVRATASEDRDFREFFGCSPSVAVELWNMLSSRYLIPSGGTIRHLLWTLMFLKVYAKTATLSSICGGIDPATHHKWVWAFIEVISWLEVEVVSSKCVDMVL